MHSIKPSLKINSSQKGFTLIEILIVVMVLGILAMVIVPQITLSTTDAKESTLSTSLVGLRNAIEFYYVQHNNVYPGAHTNAGVGTLGTAAAAATAFLEQLTQYTDVDGFVKTKKNEVTTTGKTAKFGPYLKSATLPTNPFTDSADVLCDIATDVITTRASSGTEAWKFYVLTGILIANDGAHNDL